jgi:hypothetical protein
VPPSILGPAEIQQYLYWLIAGKFHHLLCFQHPAILGLTSDSAPRIRPEPRETNYRPTVASIGISGLVRAGQSAPLNETRHAAASLRQSMQSIGTEITELQCQSIQLTATEVVIEKVKLNECGDLREADPQQLKSEQRK